MAGREGQVKTILQQNGINVQNLEVRDLDRVIAIHGSVENADAKARAEQAVEAATGVKVANHLEPRQAGPGWQQAGQAVVDTSRSPSSEPQRWSPLNRYVSSARSAVLPRVWPGTGTIVRPSARPAWPPPG